MKPKPRFIIGFVVLICLLILGSWLFFRFTYASGRKRGLPPNHPPAKPMTQDPRAGAAPAQATKTFDNVSLAKAMFAQSLSVYGRVVDQFGRPLEGAKIRFGVHDRPWESGSEYFRSSDSDGRFSISSVKGAAINTEVFMDGYYNGDQSRRVFKPGEFSSAADPFEFVLYQKGETEPVIYRAVAGVRLTSGTASAKLDFSRGALMESNEGRGQMLVEIASTPGIEHGRPWRYAIRIKGGGLQKRTHEFAFMAPKSGYSEMIAGEYAGGMSDIGNWRNSFSGDFFALLPDGTKARFKIELGTKRENYIRVSELVYNPNPNSLNLELDPEKAIEPSP